MSRPHGVHLHHHRRLPAGDSAQPGLQRGRDAGHLLHGGAQDLCAVAVVAAVEPSVCVRRRRAAWCFPRPSAKGTRCQPANAHRLSVCSKFSGKAKHDIFERIGADATLADLDRYVMLTAFCMGAEVVRVVGGVPAGRVVALMRGAGCPNLTALCGLSCIAADNAARSLLRRRRTMAPGRHDKSAAACVSLRVGVTGLRLGARGLWLHSCACPSPQAGAVSPRMATFFSRTLRCERRRHPRTFPSTRSVAGALRASACTRL